MNFLVPSALSLSLLIPIVVLLYLLKLRRVERQVSSTFLWRRIVRDLEANAPWQRLRSNLLLVVQLLVLIAFIIALSRPYTMSEDLPAHSAIIILDTSASMAATDVFPSRLDSAKEQIRQHVSALAQDVPVTMITAGIQARVSFVLSIDRRQIMQSIQDINIEMGSSDMETAILLASAIASRQPQAIINIYSDGGFEFPKNQPNQNQMRIFSIGSAGDNQAISLMKLEKSPAGEYLTAFIQLVNYSENETRRRLKITVDGTPFQVEDVMLSGREVESVVVDGIPVHITRVVAQLLPDQTNRDYLSVDDIAHSVNRQADPVRINLFTSGNRFLETALDLLPGVQLTRTDPVSAGTLPDADITVIEAALPLTTTLPAGNLFYIAPIRSTQYFSVTGVLENPSPVPASQNLDLLKHVSLSDVNILDAAEIPLPDFAEPIIISAWQGASKGPPLLFVGDTGDRKLAVLAFRLQHSDFPLQVAFPILMANLIHWLAPGQDFDIPAHAEPGEAIVINLPLDDSMPEARTRVTINLPDGRVIEEYVVDGQITFNATQNTGIYSVEVDGHNPQYFAVNLFSAQESAIRPVEFPPLAQDTSQVHSGSTQADRREWWQVFALAALILLVFEWLIYHRSNLSYFAAQVNKAR